MPVGNWWLGAGLEQSTKIGESPTAWSQSVIWGDKVLGGDLVYRNLLIWSRQIVWGTKLAGSRVAKLVKASVEASGISRAHASDLVWGPNTTVRASEIVWRGNAIWGANDNIIWGTDHVVWVTQLPPGRVLGLSDRQHHLGHW